MIPVRFPLGPFKRPELKLLGALADAPYGGPRPVPVDGLLRRDKPRHLLAVPRDDDFLAALHLVKQLAEFVFRLEDADFAHILARRSLSLA